MKKVFISQPMNGKTDVEILEARATAAREAQEELGETVEVMDTFWPDSGRSPLTLLAQSIMALAQADVAVFCPGWGQARGCKIEHTCAVEYGIDRIELGTEV